MTDIHKFSLVLHCGFFFWNVSSLDTSNTKRVSWRKTFGWITIKLPRYCKFALLRYVSSERTDSKLNLHRHFIIVTWHTYGAHGTTRKTQFALETWYHLKSVTIHGTKTHPSLLHNDNASLSTLNKGRGEEGSFAVTSWRAPWAVFTTAHVLKGVLTTREKKAINT